MNMGGGKVMGINVYGGKNMGLKKRPFLKGL